MFYDRKIEYFDYLENGDKVRNAGFVKLEVVEDFCNIQVNINGLFPTDTFTREVRIRDGSRETKLGEIELKNGRGSVQWRKLKKNRLGEEPLSYEEVCGFRIYIAKNRELLCMLRQAGEENGAAVTENMGRSEGIADIREPADPAGTTAAEDITMPAGMSGASGKGDSVYVPEASGNGNFAGMAGASGKGNSVYVPEASGNGNFAGMAGASGKGNSVYVPEASGNDNFAGMAGASGKADFTIVPEAPGKVMPSGMDGGFGMEDSLSMAKASQVAGTAGIDQPPAIVDSADMAQYSGEADASRTTDLWENAGAPPTEEEARASRRPEQKAAQSKPGVPARLYDNKWKQLTSIYPHLAPFHDERDYLSMGPGDFVVLRKEYHKLVNNSFLLHGYYNYEHLILTRVEQRGEERFYVGVPGNFYEREKQVAVMYGFESFECKTEPAQTGDYGYYMIRVDI